MSRCVVCGEQIPEGYGMVCYACCNKHGQQEYLTQLENENQRLLLLITAERNAHAETRKKLEKAEHDTKRYARRIRSLQAWHEVLVGEYRAWKKEHDILQTTLAKCVKVCEKFCSEEKVK